MTDAPRAGLRVFVLTPVPAGPFCTALAADLGAEVNKLAPPACARDMRTLRTLRIREGWSEIQPNIIAAHLLA